jgi:hypothetical protein
MFWWVCPFDYYLKIQCPGCGITRAWIHFLSGDLSRALSLNKYFLLFPLLLLFVIWRGKNKTSVLVVSLIVFMWACF